MPNSPQITISVDDDAGNTFAYVVIDSIVNNTSSGGVRIQDDVSLEEVKTLAREMTLKYSFIGLPRGGTKSGIKLPLGVDARGKQRLCEEFGKKLRPIIAAGIYYPGMDMNCGPEDLRAIYRGAGLTIGKVTDTSYFTALSIMNAITACQEACYLKGPITLAIEGFGSVGMHLAQSLSQPPFRIVAVSTIEGAILNLNGLPVDQLIEYKRKYGDSFVDRFPDAHIAESEELLRADTDILIPSARTWTINQNNSDKIRARFIVPAANAPYTTEALEILLNKGVVCLPGFVCNSGGVYGSSLFDSGVSMGVVERISNGTFKDIVKALIRKSQQVNLSAVDVATRIATHRFEERKSTCDSQTIVSKVTDRGFQKGIFPKSIYSRLRLKRFEENLVELEGLIAGFR